MFAISSIIAGLILVYYLSFFYKFVRNYISASKTGLPVWPIPVDHNHFVWMIVSVPGRPLLQKYLPTRWFRSINLGIYGWEHNGKLQPFNAPSESTTASEMIQEKSSQNDKTFLLSGCGRIELWTGSPTVAREILSRPQDFQQFDMVSLFLEIWGQNLLTTDGDIWAKHRRAVASAVTERISPVTWAESIRQVEGLLGEVCGQTGGQSGETRRLYDMMKKVAIHVLSGAGMGILREWNSQPVELDSKSSRSMQDLNKPKTGFKLSYMEAVELINRNMVGPIVIGTKALLNWPFFLPDYQNMRRLGQAKIEFALYTKEMLNKEKQRNAEAARDGEKELKKTNIMSLLIAASESNVDENGVAKGAGKKGPALTDDELVSNLYIFTAAGFDTTSNTLSFAVTLLMRYPKWQEWMYEEIDEIFGDISTRPELSDYQAIFPRCKRILAIMYETLRLFPPVSHEAKMVKTAQELTMENGRKVVIPARTTVFVDNVACQLDASAWRDLNRDRSDTADDQAEWEDSMPGRNGATLQDYISGPGSKQLGDEWRFRPTRWINSDGSLFQPPKGTFLPWSMGPRVCPGQRMAQVEFTAIFVAIFSRYKISAVRKDGEVNKEQVNKRLDLLMQNSVSKLALEMDVYDIVVEDEDRGTKVRLERRM